MSRIPNLAPRSLELLGAAAEALEPKRRKKILGASIDQALKSRKKEMWFEFVSDINDDRLATFRSELVAFYRDVRTAFGNPQSKHHVPVRIYESRSDYLDFYERTARESGESVLGFYRRGSRGDGGLLCFFDDPYDTDQVLDTARHESTHLLIAQTLQGASLPGWLEEGLAVYMAGLQEERVGPYTAEAAVLVRSAIESGIAMPFDELSSVEDPAPIHYLYAWTWVSFLMSTQEGKDRMRAYFAELKRRDEQGASQNLEPEDVRARARALFAEMFKDFVKPDRWRKYVLEVLVPTTVAQKLDYAESALDLHLYTSGIEPSPEVLSKRLEDAERWLEEASSESTGPTVARRIQLASLLLVVLQSSDSDGNTFMNLLVSVLIGLHEVVEKENATNLLADAADLAHIVGDFVRSGHDVVEEQLAALPKNANGSKEHLEAYREYMQDLRVISEALDHIVRIACIRALASDPIHRPAAHSWLFLSMRLESRADAEALFPYLLLQAERDPSDFALAALAAVYRILGHAECARDTLERAKLLPGTRDLSNFEVAASR